MANKSAEATVDKQNFANNAFTDFAPLLTLFGDEVTKQYLATSMGVADAVMLCIAPIGIMTTLKVPSQIDQRSLHLLGLAS